MKITLETTREGTTISLAKGSSSTNLLKKLYPYTTVSFIASAPMYGFTDARMAASVTNVGGYGFIACGFDFSENSAQIRAFENELIKARTLLSTHVAESARAALPIGCGFLTLQPAGFIDNVVPILSRHQVSGIWLSFPRDGADHGAIIAAIRSARAAEAVAGVAWDVRVWVQVGDLAGAEQAVRQGADVVVAQGVDAGGHQWARGAGAMVVVPEVRSLVDGMGKGGEVAVVAAGGIVDGRGVAAGLSLGADGIVMGTRFLCTNECPAPLSVKQLLVSTTDGARSTIKSDIPDLIQNYGFWAPNYNGRALVGRAYQDHLNGVSIDDLITKNKQALAEGDKEGRLIVWAGAGVGVVKEILSAQQVIRETQDEAKDILKRLSGILSRL